MIWRCVRLNFCVLTLLAFGAVSAVAGEYKGRGDVPYEGGFFSSDPDLEIRQKAILVAKQNAWKQFTTSFNQARASSYRSIESEILSDLDRYIADARVIDESVNEDAKIVSVVVRIKVNEPAFDARLAEAGSGGAAASGDGAMFSFVFVAREVASVKSYDERKTVVTSSESNSVATETATAGGGGATVGSSSKSISKAATGGSTLKKSDVLDYRVRSAGDIDAAMSDVLTTSGFEVVGYGDVYETCGGASLDDIRAEFGQSDEISSGTRKAAISGARDCEVQYFAVGTLDVGMHDVDPVSGNQRVFVSVRGQVWDISSKLPRKRASVGPIQYAGLGPDPSVAMRNALILAATEGARTIADQLNARGAR